jgi:LuxR family transcriptional regulator, maltose regulon positive regulatory protein
MSQQQASISKISPLIPGNVIRRERLFTLLDKKLPTNAFWISGPGGSGKTTFVASYLQERNIPCLWYQVDAMDGDPASFFYYLSLAAGSLMDAADEPMPLLTPEYLPNLEIFVLRYFEMLYQRIQPDSWLVFDNFQEAPEDSPLTKIITAAVQQLPGNITIAIVSRSDPPPVVSRLIANRIMQPIGRTQVAFSPEEFAAYLNFRGRGTPHKLTKQLYRITKGWIAGAVLWLLYSESKAVADCLPADYTPENIFAYFAAEIFERTDPSIRSFLMQTALLPHMTVKIAAELTGMEAGDILEHLSRHNFFIEKRLVPAVTYQYHPLFREFLLVSAAREYSSSTLCSLRCRAAKILEKHGMSEEAVNLYLKADAFEAVTPIILDMAPTLIAQGRTTILFSWIDSLPAKNTAINPWLLFWKGLAQMISNSPEGQDVCSKAFLLFKKYNALTGQVLSWTAIVESFFLLRSGFTNLDRWIKEGEQLGQLLSEDEHNPEIVGRFASSMLMALLLRDMGHPAIKGLQNQCEELLDHCHDLQVTCNILKNLFWSYHWFGQADKALVTETRLKALQNSAHLPSIVKLFFSVFFTLASITAGDHRQCLERASQSLKISDETGIHVYDFMILAYRAYSLLSTGEVSQVQPTLATMQKALMPFAAWDQAQYHFLFTWYGMLVGDLAQAKKDMATTSRLLESCGNPFTIALGRVLESQLLLELGEKDQVAGLLSSVLEEQKLGNSLLTQYLATLSLADCAYAGNQEEEGQQYLREAFALARKHGLSMPFGLINKRVGALCAKALDAGIEIDTVTDTIKRWHLQPPQPMTVSDRWPWPIRLYTLGQFTIHCHDKPLPLSGKSPGKPLELLSFLISVGQGGVFREKAAYRLWPNSDGDRAIQNLNTTLHRLRKLVGNDHAVILNNQQLSLNPMLCWVDSWHFEWLGQQVEKTMSSSIKNEYLAKALALYRGPFTTGHDHLAVAVNYKKNIEKQWRCILAAALPT